ncbi:hypothetical protein MRX96_037362 [Rhipicephalus microplus]
MSLLSHGSAAVLDGTRLLLPPLMPPLHARTNAHATGGGSRRENLNSWEPRQQTASAHGLRRAPTGGSYQELPRGDAREGTY